MKDTIHRLVFIAPFMIVYCSQWAYCQDRISYEFVNRNTKMNSAFMLEVGSQEVCLTRIADVGQSSSEAFQTITTTTGVLPEDDRLRMFKGFKDLGIDRLPAGYVTTGASSIAVQVGYFIDGRLGCTPIEQEVFKTNKDVVAIHQYVLDCARTIEDQFGQQSQKRMVSWDKPCAPVTRIALAELIASPTNYAGRRVSISGYFQRSPVGYPALSLCREMNRESFYEQSAWLGDSGEVLFDKFNIGFPIPVEILQPSMGATLSEETSLESVPAGDPIRVDGVVLVQCRSAAEKSTYAGPMGMWKVGLIALGRAERL